MNSAIERFEKLLDGPRDGALLRYSLGNEYRKAGDLARAVTYFRDAVMRDPNFTAAWKQLGQTLAAQGAHAAAQEAYHHGITVAEARGDVQAAKEMRVFLRREERASAADQ